jgi:hypothetical protein
VQKLAQIHTATDLCLPLTALGPNHQTSTDGIYLISAAVAKCVAACPLDARAKIVACIMVGGMGLESLFKEGYNGLVEAADRNNVSN